MKHIFITLFTIVFLVSCSNDNYQAIPPKLDPKQLQFKSEDDLFRLVLHIDKLNYRADEKIEIHSTLEYIGTDKKVTIWHGLPYINYYISGANDFNMGGIVATVLTSSVLKKGEVYTYPFSKNGAFSEDDPDADFWRTFYGEKELYLPPGKYTVSVASNFSLTNDVENSKYNNKVEIEITVE